MIEQIRRLLTLQQHDIRQQELETELNRMPGELAEMRKDIEELERLLRQEIESLDEVENWKRLREETLAEEEDRIQKRMQAIDQVQSAKEYVALQKDLDSIRKRVKEHEAEVLSLMETVEKRRADVQARQTEIDGFRAALVQREKQYAAKAHEIEEEFARMKTQREELVQVLDKTVYRKYDFLAKRRFPPVAKAEASRCLGCNMGIPPQMFNQLYDMKELFQCPHCTRILYIEETLS